MTVHATFLGAADTVTGSRTLIESDAATILVDCGLFQGYKVLRERNRLPFPVDPRRIDAVVVTHAHLDHTGYLPALVRDGFRGPIHTTLGTAELSRILLADSAHLLEEEARHAARHGWSTHDAPEPLYTTADAERASERFAPSAFDRPVELPGGAVATFIPAGHILGAAGVHLEVDGLSVHFSGDVGRPDDPLMRPPRRRPPSDVLVTESTYGDRRHGDDDPEALLGDAVRRTVGRGGVVLVAAFAVGRTESVLLHLSRLRDRGELPDVPVFVNSPMASEVASVYREHPEEHRIRGDELARMYGLATFVRSADESKLLNLRGGPMIIVSASGMLAGGRILHHLDAYGSDSANCIVLAGFQAGGTRGAALRDGARSLRIHGRDVPIRAEVVTIGGFSAHADADELVAWIGDVSEPPRMVYVTHGEPGAADALRARIKRGLRWPVRVPEHLERVDLARDRKESRA